MRQEIGTQLGEFGAEPEKFAYESKIVSAVLEQIADELGKVGEELEKLARNQNKL